MNFKWNKLSESKPQNKLSCVAYWHAIRKDYVVSTGDYDAIKDNIKECTHWALLIDPPEEEGTECQ